MNNFSPTRGKLPQAAVWTALLAVLAQLCWLQLQPNSALSASVAQLKSPTRALGVCQESDELAAQVGPGNLFLHIVGCPKTDPNAEATHTFSEFRDFSLSVWYFRMNYDLYPRRVFAASPDTVINGGSDLMGLTFFPDPAWLSAHDVQSILTLGFDAAGRTLPPRWEKFTGASTTTGGN